MKILSQELETQNRIIKFFQQTFRYDYFGNWQDRENSNIEKVEE